MAAWVARASAVFCVPWRASKDDASTAAKPSAFCACGTPVVAPATPLTAENLAWHVVFGLGSRHVESVMVDGVWRVWARRPLSVNPSVVAEQAREAAAAVWARMSEK